MLFGMKKDYITEFKYKDFVVIDKQRKVTRYVELAFCVKREKK